ncbi:hypothetical protein AB3S75_023895 [Citrus x aurantiifolia]
MGISFLHSNRSMKHNIPFIFSNALIKSLAHEQETMTLNPDTPIPEMTDSHGDVEEYRPVTFAVDPQTIPVFLSCDELNLHGHRGCCGW